MARQPQKRTLREDLLEVEELLLSFGRGETVRVCLEQGKGTSKPYSVAAYLPFGDFLNGTPRIIDTYDTEDVAVAAYKATLCNLRNGLKVEAKSHLALTLRGNVRPR